MKSRLSAGPLACAIILSALTGAAVVEARKDGGPSWERQTEQELGVGRGVARQLTSEEEWQEHRQKMMSLPPAERERYRQEWHEKMRARAKEKGIELPQTPGPHRGGPGGMHPRRGVGGGRGMGRGRGGGGPPAAPPPTAPVPSPE